MTKVNRGKRLRTMPDNVYRAHLQNQLLKHVDTTDRDKCWLWQGGKNRGGYGTTRLFGVTANSHRASYHAFKGDIPTGMCVCHTCDIPSCINPDHLFLGTVADNMADVLLKGRRPTGSQDRRSIPVRIGNVVYGSIGEAARQLGKKRGSIRAMVLSGKATKVKKETDIG